MAAPPPPLQQVHVDVDSWAALHDPHDLVQAMLAGAEWFESAKQANHNKVQPCHFAAALSLDSLLWPENEVNGFTAQ